MFAALYNVSSVYRVVEFVKTIYGLSQQFIPVIIKPTGAAAQIGVPEANKIAYRLDRPLIVLPSLGDVNEVLGVKRNFIISARGSPLSISSLLERISSVDGSICLTIMGEENDFTRQELEFGEPIIIEELPRNIPPIVYMGLILYLITKETAKKS